MIMSFREARTCSSVTDDVELVVQRPARQRAVLPGETLTASLIADLAREVITVGERIRDTDKLIEDRIRRHRHARVITSMPGIGPVLGAEFLAATRGDMTWFATADRLAGFAGLAPAPRGSGRIRGNLQQPRRYHSLNRDQHPHLPRIEEVLRPETGRGQEGHPGVLALAHRRVNVMWALLREDRLTSQGTPTRTSPNHSAQPPNLIITGQLR